MTITINVNGLSLVHRGSGGVSRATLSDVCRTPPGQAPLPYENVAFSRHLASFPRSVRVDGGHPPAHAVSIFAVSEGDEAGALGGVVSGTVAGAASWLTYSIDVKIEGRGACRLTDKMLHNSGNTINCAGVTQAPVVAKGASASGKAGRRRAKARAATKRKPHRMEIALPFFGDAFLVKGSDGQVVIGPDGAGVFNDALAARARELGVTYFRIFLQWIEGALSARLDAEVKAIRAAGFGVQISVLGIASPWGQPGGKNGHGVMPPVKAFAKFFSAVVDRLKPLGVKRFSVWNEPNHSGFLRCGPYWKTKHAKERIKRVRELKRQQQELEQAQNKAAADQASQEADRVWDAELTKNDRRQIAAERGKGSRRGSVKYKLFDIEANAAHYRKLYEAAYSATKKKGIQIWLGELSSGGALRFLDLLVDPEVVKTKRCLRTHALALHPYQYLVPPTKPPAKRPQFLPKAPLRGDDPEPVRKAKEARNKAIDAAKEKKWPSNAKKRRRVIRKAQANAGIGALAAVQHALSRMAKGKKLTTPKGKKVALYLTEFGYHRERSKLQPDRQVPENRRKRWVPLAYTQAYKARVRQNLYYHLVHTWEGHEWDSGILSPVNQPDPTFEALKGWVQGAKAKKWIKETV
jgi:hypothetical protein